MSDIEFYRDDEDPHETVEVRYLSIPGRELAANGLREIDEIVYRDLHLETLDLDHAHVRVAGVVLNVRAVKVGHYANLSITCEPDGATLVDQGEVCRADDDRVRCPNGCYGRLGDGCHGEPVPRYCGFNGCDAESPGMAYKPDEEWGPDSAAQELERGPR
jgi:hypothetical protein